MITTFNDDCTQVEIAPGSVDLILTDPPYNISKNGAKPVWNKVDESGQKVNANTVHSQKFDENFDDNWDDRTPEEFKDDLASWAAMWHSALRPGGSFAIFISDRYLSHLWDALEAVGLEPKRVWTWKKPAAVPFNRKVNPVSGAEYILWGVKPKGKRTFNSDAVAGSIVERYSFADKASSIVYKHLKDNPDIAQAMAAAEKEIKKVRDSLKRTGDIVHCVIPNTITFSGGGSKSRIHPTQKPVELLTYFIELLTNEGDLVLDTFAGSGSTGVAASQSNRRAILIERDAKMFAKMEGNLSQTRLQTSLFNRA